MVLLFKKINNDKFTKTIFEINNDPFVRKYSVNSKRFSFEKHSKWLKKVLNEKKETIFLVIKKKIIIGLIRLKVKKNKNYLSWSVKRSHRGKNYGKKMLKMYVDINKKKYFAKIKKNNIPSIKICEYAGFKKFRENSKFRFFVKLS